MSAFHQLGHHSESMVLEDGLREFAGAILSPVNYTHDETIEQCARFRDAAPNLDIWFDPQLYVPRTERQKLREWGFAGDGFETADLSSGQWWQGTIARVVQACAAFEPSAVCSPAIMPRAFDDNYFGALVDGANRLADSLPGPARPVMTALVGLQDLARESRHLEVATYLTRFRSSDVYLVLADDTVPRLERRESGELEAAARLIRLLQNNGYRVCVGFTSSEMLLWKFAGATSGATGKFFNLRRFAINRWDEPEQGGRNVPYWFEPSLLAFLREADLQRYRREFGISEHHQSNPYSAAILQKINDPAHPAWLADSWRQFLHWFAETERLIGNDQNEAQRMLDVAAARWQAVQDVRLPFEEPRNNGEWIRSWQIALSELDRRPD